MKKTTYLAMYTKSFIDAIEKATTNPKNKLYEDEYPFLYIISNILNSDRDALKNLIILPMFYTIYNKDADYIEEWGSLEYKSDEDYDLYYFDVSGWEDADKILKGMWSDLTDENTLGAILLNLFKNPNFWADAENFLTDTVWTLAKEWAGA